MLLAVDDLSVRRGGVVILDHVSFLAPQGEVVGIVGKSGMGKTTLLRAILGLEPDAHGRVQAGTHEAELPAPWMGQSIQAVRARVSVFFGPESLRPYERIGDRLLRLRKNSPARDSALMTSLAARLGIAHLLNRYPNELSTGQRARAGVLACLSSGRPIVLIDEFGSNLDEATQDELFATAADYSKSGRTVALVSHNKNRLESIASRLYEINDTKVRIISCEKAGL